MKLETYTLTTIISVLSSVGFGMIVTAWGMRKKTKAETMLARAQTQFTGIEMYSQMLADLQKQVDNQAKQIINLQEKETQYLKIINSHNTRERGLIKRIRQLETEIEQLKKSNTETHE